MQPNLKGTDFSTVVSNSFCPSVISQRGVEYPTLTLCTTSALHWRSLAHNHEPVGAENFHQTQKRKLH